MSKRVWFHRLRAIGWVVIGIVSFPLGWANNIILVMIASMYANAVSDWTAAEAADDHVVLDRLAEMDTKIERLLAARTCHHSVISDHAAEEAVDPARPEPVPLGDSG